MKLVTYTQYLFIIIASLLLLSCDATQQKVSSPGEVVFTIDLPDSKPQVFKTTIKKNDTVFVALMQIQKEGSFSFEYNKSPLGVLVHTILNIKNKKKGKAWVYSINNKLAQKGVDSITLSKADKVRWCFLAYDERKKCTMQ